MEELKHLKKKKKQGREKLNTDCLIQFNHVIKKMIDKKNKFLAYHVSTHCHSQHNLRDRQTTFPTIETRNYFIQRRYLNELYISRN